VTPVVSVLASVVAVVLVLSVPHLLHVRSTSSGPDGPPRPSPSVEPDRPGTRSWQKLTCPPPAQDSCAAPTSINHAGVTLHSVAGVRREVGSGASTAVVSLRLSRAEGDRWVLVGAERAGSGSTLAVGLGSAQAMTVPAGTLSLFPAPRRGQVVVTVRERGRPRDGEVLRIQEYRSSSR
jgi:hypothetical protein